MMICDFKKLQIEENNKPQWYPSGFTDTVIGEMTQLSF